MLQPANLARVVEVLLIWHEVPTVTHRARVVVETVVMSAIDALISGREVNSAPYGGAPCCLFSLVERHRVTPSRGSCSQSARRIYRVAYRKQDTSLARAVGFFRA